ncbi:hypothetical protein QTL95_21670 [Rhizobium sp. S152]|uniref:patatin-like phospholipase family protein n=1 Tax=Rhizobium sp. S152 TaxID=3055038 RepID=UPI0025AA07FD|nr:patatin-like phospholipase family protein [Rhizobium sp. S152]MDM9628510.1 hypothetical protein [Rhizobium sp. S152]
MGLVEMTGQPTSETALFHDQFEMLREERKAIWGDKEVPADLSGISLSGGGIKSGIVALGVLQTLAAEGLLNRFHFLSTVSGGGYIGTSLTWFWSSVRLAKERLARPGLKAFGSGSDDFPFQEIDWKDESAIKSLNKVVQRKNAEEWVGSKNFYEHLSVREMAAKNLEFLRNHGSYLTSGDGIGLAGLFVALVRTIMISLLVWIPLLIASFMGIATIDRWIKTSWDCPFLNKYEHPLFTLFLWYAGVLGSLFFLGVVFLALTRAPERRSGRTAPFKIVSSILWIGAGSLAIVLASYLSAQLANLQGLSGSAIFGLYAFALGSIGGAFMPLAGANPAYVLRRLFERFSSLFLPLSSLSLLIGLAPELVEHLQRTPQDTALEFGHLILPNSLIALISLMSGIVAALYGYYLKAKSVNPSLAGQIFGITSAALFIATLLVGSLIVGQELVRAPSLDTYLVVVCNCLFFLALALGLFSSINSIGLHRFYRDRLMETFMPMVSRIEAGVAGKTTIADSLSVTEMWDGPSDLGRRPYHIINTHVILNNDEVAKISVRGGDNFCISGAFVGSQATGWMRTESYVERHGSLSVASAMAASGAAANAHAGYIGTGLTRTSLISAVMSFFNLRLGLWVGNPNAGESRSFWRQRSATYLRPGLASGIFGKGYNRGSRFLELSDGGHFENLGLYELVRRKVSLAMVVDAEQDETISLSSLVSAVSRVKEDFGVVIHFEDSIGPALLIGQESRQYPAGVKIAKSPFIVGEIRYPDKKVGVIVYIKATMMAGLDFATDGYRASNPAFPHQSTIDQFFEPTQFEAYRDLGRKSAKDAIDALKLTENFALPGNIFPRYQEYWKEKEAGRAASA